MGWFLLHWFHLLPSCWPVGFVNFVTRLSRSNALPSSLLLHSHRLHHPLAIHFQSRTFSPVLVPLLLLLCTARKMFLTDAFVSRHAANTTCILSLEISALSFWSTSSLLCNVIVISRPRKWVHKAAFLTPSLDRSEIKHARHFIKIWFGVSLGPLTRDGGKGGFGPEPRSLSR